MTLAERLASEALPCLQVEYASDGTCSTVEYLSPCPHCERRPVVEAVLREMVEACAELADENPFNGYGDKYIARNIRALLTEEETP